MPGGLIESEDFSGTASAVKIYSSDVTVTEGTTFKHARVKGNLILKGQGAGNLSFENLIVEGDLDLSEVEGFEFDFNGVTVLGETIF